MKGIELPINILIIIAIAIIVLIAVVSMFYGPFSSGTETVSSDIAKNDACQILISRKCNVLTSDSVINNFDANRDNSINGGATAFPTNCTAAGGATRDNLASLCICYYSITTEAGCKDFCGC
jgi:hypothetical protein